ncbi:MAG: ribonuclease Z [Ruminococcus sp.]|nr:ribonuclease Z [Ruminococcus sp.]
MEIYLPGTGGMKPLPCRALTGMWAEHEGGALLIDCGEGMQVALAKCKRSLARLEVIVITHFHADHTAGLPGLLLSAGNSGRTADIDIYTPRGGREMIASLCRICGTLPFKLNIRELQGENMSFDWRGVKGEVMAVRHRTECHCCRLTERRRAVFDPKKAEELGVPVKLWKTLHGGESVVLNGRTIEPWEVIAGQRKPLRVTYITDTVYFDGLAEFAEASQLLICEGMYGSDEYIPKMREKGHMVFSEAAKTAAAAGAEELWLTHYSPALADPEEYAGSVREIFANTVISRDGIHRTIK